MAKLKELGILNPPNAPEHLLLFLPLVPSSWGKVVSTTLGAPPPDLDAHVLGSPWRLIEMRNPSSLTVTLTVTPTLLTAVPCGGGKSGATRKGNRNHGPQSARRDGYKSSDKDRDRNRDRDMIDPKER